MGTMQERLLGAGRSGKGENFYPRSRGILTFSSKQVTSGNVFGLKVTGTFDAVKLCKKITSWQKRILHRAGRYVRSTMKNSMKEGKFRPDKRYVRKGMTKEEMAELPQVMAHSEPGEPPRYWSRLIKDSIFYFVDEYRAVVTIGPQRKNKRGNALEVLEFGGTIQLPQGGNAYVAPRPYVAPAQIIGEEKLKQFLRETKPIF